MSEPTGVTPEEAHQRLIQRTIEDGDLRQRLLADPKGTVEHEIGATLPEGIEIRVVEESPEVVYLVLPPNSAASGEAGELSDRELEAVAGGWDPAAGTSDETCAPRGMACRPRV